MCDDRELLIAYLYDEADASSRRRMDAHLTTCADCREELRSLRAVRQDLLAWDVPEHQSVWKPFVSPTPAVWWRQVPAWGFAAAAVVMFGFGLAGGLAARALMPAPVAMAAAPPTTAPVQAVSTASAEEVQQLRERLASLEKAALTPTTPAAAQATLTRAELEQLISESEGRINKRTAAKLFSMVRDIQSAQDRGMQALSQQITDAQGFNARALTTALNRTEKEKE